jgi:putative addiction module killer protein
LTVIPDVKESRAFSEWVTRLRDSRAVAKIVARVDRLRYGNPGDVKSVGGGILEMRIDYGPGYRVYFTRRGPSIVLLLCGGDKRTQQQDILRAQRIALLWSD